MDRCQRGRQLTQQFSFRSTWRAALAQPGAFGSLGRNTFRSPAYYDYDFALIEDTPVGRRASGVERIDLQFRAEFFNLYKVVNLGSPANTLTGAGFGEISRTAGTSRQIQFSLKLIY